MQGWGSVRVLERGSSTGSDDSSRRGVCRQASSSVRLGTLTYLRLKAAPFAESAKVARTNARLLIRIAGGDHRFEIPFDIAE